MKSKIKITIFFILYIFCNLPRVLYRFVQVIYNKFKFNRRVKYHIQTIKASENFYVNKLSNTQQEAELDSEAELESQENTDLDYRLKKKVNFKASQIEDLLLGISFYDTLGKLYLLKIYAQLFVSFVVGKFDFLNNKFTLNKLYYRFVDSMRARIYVSKEGDELNSHYYKKLKEEKPDHDFFKEYEDRQKYIEKPNKPNTEFYPIVRFIGVEKNSSLYGEFNNKPYYFNFINSLVQ
jgi:hypothetical protein